MAEDVKNRPKKTVKNQKAIERFLKLLVDAGGSDLHLKSGATPKARIHGSIQDLSREILSPKAVENIIDNVLKDSDRSIFERDNEVDFVYEIHRLGRFRVNIYKQMLGWSIAVRHISMHIPTPEELHLPKVIYTLLNRPRGLILVTGATGSGKSTTMASMVDVLNREMPLNIITVEDPIEFTFKERRSTIQQREVGMDTPTLQEALRHIVRQDPDVIMLGEIRDRDTMMSALNIANTGHLVFSTMHTTDASQTINRAISLASSEMAGEVRHLFAATLIGVVSQRLVKRADKAGRIPAVEVLLSTESVRKAITDPEVTTPIKRIIQDGHGQYNMQTFDQSLLMLVKEKKVSVDEALKHATSPTDFKIKLRDMQNDNTDWNAQSVKTVNQAPPETSEEKTESKDPPQPKLKYEIER